jgi:hypothetical protein
MQEPIVLTEEEYTRLKEQNDKFHTWLGKRTHHKPEEVPAGYEPICNAAISLLEVYEFLNDPPERYFAYVGHSHITTWTGDILGSIVAMGVQFSSNFGDKRQSLRVKAINGKIYAGTYYKSAGDYCRLKAVKN